jgi:hypothetical protein
MKFPEVKVPGLSFGKADLEKYFSGVKFPASKQDLINTARQNNAPDNVITTMDKLPDQTYNSADDVVRTLQKT